VTFRAWIEENAVRQIHDVPDEALDDLVRLMARVCDDPYDAVLSLPVRPGDASERMAEIADGRGFVEFRVDEQARLVRIYALAWIG
jgi:hypothetical protein